MKPIPLIIPNYNQKTYLVNIINWWNYYTNNAPVYVLDNASTYEPLLSLYKNIQLLFPNVTLQLCEVNNCGDNLRTFLNEYIHDKYDYYVISNPDIQPKPDVPENFLAIFKEVLDLNGFHRVGFGLAIDDIPEDLHNKTDVIKNETPHWKHKVLVTAAGKKYKGFRTGIDLTFCLYKTENGGWLSTKEGGNFANALRLFMAYHFGWYVNNTTTIEENINYFKTARTKKTAQSSSDVKGVNTYAPAEFKDMIKAAGVYETLAVLKKEIIDKERVFYVRFGDGDLLLMNGGNDKFHAYNKKLQEQLVQSFKITDECYIKGLAVNYPIEKGMKPGLFAPFEYNEKLAKVVKRFTKERNFYNPVVFQYLYVFDKFSFNKFFQQFIHRAVIFVGCIDAKLIEKLIDLNVYTSIETKAKDSFDDFDTIEKQLIEAIKKYPKPPLVICATGLTTRALAKSVYQSNVNCYFIDIGSVVDAAAGLETRKWIKLNNEK
jgi:hypothetical protein